MTSIGHGVKEIAEAMAEQARKVAFVPDAPLHQRAAAGPGRGGGQVRPRRSQPGVVRLRGLRGHRERRQAGPAVLAGAGSAVQVHVIGRWQSFHGNTFASMGFGGHTIRRRKYVPMFNESSHLPPMYCYRCHFKQTYPSCDTYCADYLERLIRMQGPENVAAFIAEPVVGATLGAVPPVPEYFPKIRAICDRYQVLFIADEVMTGFGRTGANFAVDHWGVVPDLIATAKGISGGYIPLGAVIVRDEIVAAFEKNKSNFVGRPHLHRPPGGGRRRTGRPPVHPGARPGPQRPGGRGLPPGRPPGAPQQAPHRR